MQYIFLLICLFCFNVNADYDVTFYVGTDESTSSVLYDTTSSTSYTVALTSSEITSQSNVFYIPLTVTDSSSNQLSNVSFSINNTILDSSVSNETGDTIITVPVTLAQIRAASISGTVVIIPVVMTVSVDAETSYTVYFNLYAHTTCSLSVTPTSIGWTFTGNWADCSSTLSLTYNGAIYNMNVSITSDNNFQLVSETSVNSISYSIENSGFSGNKTSGYNLSLTDAVPTYIDVYIDPSNSVLVRAGNYQDTITIRIAPDI